MSLVYLNGDFVPKLGAKLSVYDHGLLFGDGVWEGLRLRDGDVPDLEAHGNALFAAAQTLAIVLPFARTEWANLIRQAIAKNSRRNGYIRVVVTRGPGTLGLDPRKCDPHVILFVEDVVPFPGDLYSHGLHVITASLRLDSSNPLHRVRSLSHAHMTLAKSEALRAGCLDAILLTPMGEVAGTCEGQIFAVKSGAIYTSPWELRLPTDVFAEGLHALEKRLTLADLHDADEVFLAGTAPGIIGIVRIDGREIGDGREGPMTRTIRLAPLSRSAPEAIS